MSTINKIKQEIKDKGMTDIQTLQNTHTIAKNCKSIEKHLDNCLILPNLQHKFKKEEKERLIKLAYKTDLITYIKVLLEAYKSLPNIINIIDRIIEKRASSIPAVTVFGSAYYSTYNEMNKMLDMSARKDKLLNLYVIIEKMLDSLEEKDRKITVLKFVQKCTTDEIAKETNSAERTIYRTVNKIIEKLALYMYSQGWDVCFVKEQIGRNEPWLEDLFYRKKKEELNKKPSKKNED